MFTQTCYSVCMEKLVNGSRVSMVDGKRVWFGTVTFDGHVKSGYVFVSFDGVDRVQRVPVSWVKVAS